MKNRNLKKVFAFFLSVVMSLSLYVTPVFAEETEELTAEEAMFLETLGVTITEESTMAEVAEETTEEALTEEVVEAATEESTIGEDILVSGKSGKLNWNIDGNGKLTITGSGDYQPIKIEKKIDANTTQSYYAPEWCKYGETIKTVEVNANNLTSTEKMFYGCNKATSMNLKKLDTSKVKTMMTMFGECYKLQSLDLSSFNTSKVTNMSGMFLYCHNLESVNLSSFNTANVTNMYAMFFKCWFLDNLDLSKWDMKNVTDGKQFFYHCFNLNNVKMAKNVKVDIEFPEGSTEAGTWYDQNGKVCTIANKNVATPMAYAKNTVPKPITSNNTQPSGNNGNASANGQVASYQGNSFVKDGNGKMHCYDANGNAVINDFKCDGTYTYYFQADGTAMTDRLTYHPDGKNVIYFDENGHEVFNNFTHVKKSITGDAVDDLCFFDVYGHMYVDFITYDQSGTNLYYANEYGVMERSGWFGFSEKQGGGIGYANSDGTLVTNQFSYDAQGRLVYFQGDGKLARGLISDGTTYYQMDENDGHCVGQFPVQ